MIKIYSETLKNATQKVAKVATADRINEFIEIATIGSKCTFRATSTEAEIVVSVEAEILEEGKILLPAQKFTSFVGKISEGDVFITEEEKQILMQYDRKNKVTFAKDEVTELLNFNKEEVENAVSVNADFLKEVIRNSLLFTSRDSHRPLFRSLFFDLPNNSVVATDTFKLLWSCCQFNTTDGEAFILPERAAKELARLLSLADVEKVKIKSKNNIATFYIGESVFSSKLLDGQYVNYKSVIPQKHSSLITIEREDVYKALERALLINNNWVALKVTQDGLTLFTEQQEVLSEVVPVIEKEGEDITLVVNPSFLLDALKYSDEVVQLAFINEVSPITIMSEQNKTTSIVLPVRMPEVVKKVA